ncbi:MAG: 16S rRNA (cytosine(1402)-N(4))-methyltransferase RsmH [Paludibacteraceae bacterium]|nr:16S rRNA (cytosine(1402)-N(4))-methyltransferase RsmH [Paludibacteraceae bacterium]MBN2788292.1 16S rRNA (cytosine(1402)-N(4))-methyltransferase RsmH [Paludibacteraceae bacterium]
MSDIYHIPALLKETIDGLQLNRNGVYVDVTFGGGGHSNAILSGLGPEGKLIAFDQDEDALLNRIDDDRFVFVQSNFKYLKNFLKYHHVEQIDGLLADLGVSFHHFDQQERGFSFRFDADLDMRMNKKSALTAATIINTYPEEKLATILYLYGELTNSRKIAKRICDKRKENEIQRVNEFLEILKPFFFREKEKKDMARVFQALRIEVNNEMEILQSMLLQSLEMLKPGGRLVVLTYHSLEDRLVKNFMKTGNFEGVLSKDYFGNPLTPFKVITSKPIVASANEQSVNPRSRSAKLRIAEKK